MQRNKEIQLILNHLFSKFVLSKTEIVKRLRNFLLTAILLCSQGRIVYSQNSIEISGGFLNSLLGKPIGIGRSQNTIQASIGFNHRIANWYSESFNLGYQFSQYFSDRHMSVGFSYTGNFYPLAKKGNNFLSINLGTYVNRLLVIKKGENAEFIYNPYPNGTQFGALMGISLEQNITNYFNVRARMLCQKALINFIDDEWIMGFHVGFSYILPKKNNTEKIEVLDNRANFNIKKFTTLEFKLNYASNFRGIQFLNNYSDYGIYSSSFYKYKIQGIEIGTAYIYERLKIEANLGLFSYHKNFNFRSTSHGHFPHAPSGMVIGSSSANSDYYSAKTELLSYKLSLGYNLIPPTARVSLYPIVTFNYLEEIHKSVSSNYRTMKYHFYSSGPPGGTPHEEESFTTYTPSRISTNKYLAHFSFGMDLGIRVFKGLKVNFQANFIFMYPKKSNYLVYTNDAELIDKQKLNISIGIGYQIPFQTQNNRKQEKRRQ